MFEIVDSQVSGPIIKVIGVGGAGGNAVNHMIEQGVQGVEFIAVNTDAQVLQRNKAGNQIQLGSSGLGAGAKPEEARSAAVADRPARTWCSSPPAWAAAPEPAPRP
jgi:cell division protein FtsZ